MPHGPTLEQLEAMARVAGYVDYRTMLYELYVVASTSIVRLNALTGIGPNRLKRHLKMYGLDIKGKGGANNVKIVMTPILLREIALYGVPTVARRLGVEPSVLYNRLKDTKL